GGDLLVAPHRFEEPVARDHFAAMLDEIAQEVELLASEPHLPARAEGLAAAQANAHVAEGELLELLPRAGTPQHRANPRQELAQAEGLGHVVIGAQLQSLDAIGFLAAGGQHDDGNVEPLGAQLAADVPAAHARHHDVEKEQVRRLRQREGEAAPAIAGGARLIALEAKVVLEAPGHAGLGAHDQDARHVTVPFTPRSRSHGPVEGEPAPLAQAAVYRHASPMSL